MPKLWTARFANLANLLAKICPICLGVSGTWLFLSALILLGYLPSGYLWVVALFLGASVVGVADRFPQRKSGVMLLGFALAYLFLVTLSWATWWMALALMGGLAYFLFFRSSKGAKRGGKLEKELEKCC